MKEAGDIEGDSLGGIPHDVTTIMPLKVNLWWVDSIKVLRMNQCRIKRSSTYQDIDIGSGPDDKIKKSVIR